VFDLDTLRNELAAIVASSDDAIIGKTLGGVITSWNRGAEGLYGYTAEEVVGKPISIIMPPDRQGEMPDILETLALGERVEHYETQRVRKDGRRVTVSVSVSPIRSRTGEIIGAASINRDLTARKALAEVTEQSEAWLAATFRASPTPLLALELASLRFVDANESFLRLAACTWEELSGGGVASILNPEELEGEAERLRRGEPDPPSEVSLKTKAGETVQVLKSSEVALLRGTRCLLGVFTHVTKERQREAALLETLKGVFRDASLFTQSVAERLRELEPSEPPRRLPPLTKRERDLLRLIAKGYDNRRVASELGLAEQTVRNYVARLYGKLCVHSRAEAVVWAREQGMG